MTIESFEFQTETKQLLDLMIHSVYSHKEIFLRELISNASDALDKLRFGALKHPDLGRFTSDLHVQLVPDKKANTLAVEDNGIGMSREEVVRYLGTIAKSGTTEFMKLVKDSEKSGDLSPELIGQFGVGFYSSFMVADKVTVLTRKAGEEMGVRWESRGDGTYTIEESQRFEPGTTVTLHLKPVEDDEGNYTLEWTLKDLVKKYSDFIAYPIMMKVERREPEMGADGKPIEGREITVEKDERLNSEKAIWTRPEKDVSAEEYDEFYQYLTHDWNKPLKRILYRGEGTSEFRALLFVPSKAPWDIFMRERDANGIHLYIRRVFIMNDCKELIPEYLRFMRGVVDSEDLSLNISREILQKNRQIQVIRKSTTRKVLDALKAMLVDEKESYLEFWKEFGRVLKEGIFQDQANRTSVLDICLFHSTAGSELTTLEQYVGRMKDGQEVIYYITGPSLAAIEKSPHLEAFRDKGYEVLLLTDPVDEVWAQQTPDYMGKKLQSIGKGAAELGTEEERKKVEDDLKEKEKTYRSLLDAIKSDLKDDVKDVRLTSRLTESPACLVGDQFDMTPFMEQLLRASGQEVPKLRRILELNPSHPIVEKLNTLFDKNSSDPLIKEYAELLLGQALLAEGTPLADPAGFSKKVADLMSRAL